MRSWDCGDLIVLKLDMRCRLLEGPQGSSPGSQHFRALMKGPVVLARDENLDPKYNEPVDVIAVDGFVEVKVITPELPQTNMQLEVPTRTGLIQMVDYASVNSWHGKHVQTWLPMATVFAE